MVYLQIICGSSPAQYINANNVLVVSITISHMNYFLKIQFKVPLGATIAFTNTLRLNIAPGSSFAPTCSGLTVASVTTTPYSNLIMPSVEVCSILFYTKKV